MLHAGGVVSLTCLAEIFQRLGWLHPVKLVNDIKIGSILARRPSSNLAAARGQTSAGVGHSAGSWPLLPSLHTPLVPWPENFEPVRSVCPI